MARPAKNYCDYFPHDRDMRNHRKVKAIRTKFGITGYAIWAMFLEYLTGIDGNEFEQSESEMELIAGDFGVSVAEISDILNYCIKLELLFIKNGFIHSESLDENLLPVYEKRKVSKGISRKQQRINGKFSSNNSVSNGVSVTEIPQSIVDKSKVNKSKDTPPVDDGTWESEKNKFRIAEQWQMKQCTEFKLSKTQLLESVENFLRELDTKEDYKNISELKRHWYGWYKFYLGKPKQSQPELSEYQKDILRQREIAKKRTAQ